MAEIPDSHPRKASLMARQKMVDASSKGLLADSAMIAHGRGEAYDYLIGERTIESASLAISEAAARLVEARNPVISVNGNTVVLAGGDLIRLAAIVNCPIEVNLYYRTEDRVSGLLSLLDEQRESVASGSPPMGWQGSWRDRVLSVPLLGSDPDGSISGLEGPRSMCCSNGIGRADVVLVPLEDGDRCEALISLGKQVLVIDLNPLSRTARNATVTIVDEVSRAAAELVKSVLNPGVSTEWNNEKSLKEALSVISNASSLI
ncbi:MAG: phosphopantothenate/pantothenate synthetase [Euryarchaeota archaeon]|nr:phosphopantothenate/pantothenate synthetase [Euryarchaeota archaeon]|tara:strand:+ start:19259 stop:20041 length:783 start_codon:yes stop_codon:yes gene_type:complete